jgi:hypothetical protein
MMGDMQLDIKQFPALHRLIHPRHKNFSLYVRDIPGEIYSMYLREGLNPPTKIQLSVAIRSGYPEDAPSALSSPEISPIPTDEELSDAEEHDDSCHCRGCGEGEKQLKFIQVIVDVVSALIPQRPSGQLLLNPEIQWIF